MRHQTFDRMLLKLRNDQREFEEFSEVAHTKETGRWVSAPQEDLDCQNSRTFEPRLRAMGWSARGR